MLNLNRILGRINRHQLAPLCRFVSDQLQETPTISLRQRTYLETKQRYKNHEHVVYSSYLEKQEEHMSYGLKRSLINKLKRDRKRQQKELQLGYGNSSTEIPKNWMDEYEYYSGPLKTAVGEDQEVENTLGTADPSVQASKVPCNGCGAHLHCNHHTRPGFIPLEIFNGRTTKELKTIVCQRCHFLKHYNIALDVEVTPETYVETISRIQDQYALAIVIVDLLDFPSSIWPDMQQVLGSKRPVFIVGNKVDLLPRDCNGYLDHIKLCLKEEIIKTGFDKMNIKYVSLISAKTGYGVEELITQLQKIWAYKGDVYLVGCTNVGKSSLFNILLNSDYNRPEASELISRATTCPWPGTTLQMLKFPIYRPSEIRVYERLKRLKSEKFAKAEMEKLRLENARKNGIIEDAVPMGVIGRTFIRSEEDEVADPFAVGAGTSPITTLNERSKDYQQARWVYDTPGVLHPDQITNLLTAKELMELQPKQMISPRAYRLKPGMSLFVAGLARLDFLNSNSEELDWVQVFLFASFNLPTMVVKTEGAHQIYERYLNTPLMHVPMGDDKRISQWPGLQCHPEEFHIKGYILKPKINEVNCAADITLSSVGWVGVRVPVDIECTFKAWTPGAKGIYCRNPSLVPYAERLIGKKIRNSLAYNTSKPFIFKK
ncbi:nitric oxide-associated protein 1 [Stomoxys calcitrans]|uniref:nitric oxide-associated protein 1 n=1 Tax=Stomoxys calcitrans TaxID=35570 RepID=UPI0027E22282|nr:nitric oxide-associated protein 1 [Stomoxys calcitrans]